MKDSGGCISGAVRMVREWIGKTGMARMSYEKEPLERDL